MRFSIYTLRRRTGAKTPLRRFHELSFSFIIFSSFRSFPMPARYATPPFITPTFSSMLPLHATIAAATA
jgi:hypothetical protein